MFAQGTNYVSSLTEFQIVYCDDNEVRDSETSFSGNQILFPEKGRSFKIQNNGSEVFIAGKPYKTTANGWSDPQSASDKKWTLVHNGSSTSFALFKAE